MSDDFLRSLVRPPGPHHCFGHLPSEADGPAIIMCEEAEDGTLWAGNIEYSSQVAFCPYCGFRAAQQPAVGDDDGFGGKLKR
jgi:hypothetical protein